ncbi:MAG TPA: hypothetical protein VFT95_13395, partial [Micromonosporaceae bacterium]|nr:hypothetical protein [Micromonosporaceae bacterium]
MKIWPAVRDEVQGAWRSMRYDMARRPGRPGAQQAGGNPVELGRPEARHVPADYDPYEGGPRRVLVSAGMAALIVGG